MANIEQSSWSDRFEFCCPYGTTALEIGMHFNRAQPAREWWKRDLRAQNL
jgi:hypothetical protein